MSFSARSVIDIARPIYPRFPARGNSSGARASFLLLSSFFSVYPVDAAILPCFREIRTYPVPASRYSLPLKVNRRIFWNLAFYERSRFFPLPRRLTSRRRALSCSFFSSIFTPISRSWKIKQKPKESVDADCATGATLKSRNFDNPHRSARALDASCIIKKQVVWPLQPGLNLAGPRGWQVDRPSSNEARRRKTHGFRERPDCTADLRPSSGGDRS